MPLVPEAGGTERITSLISKGLSERGYNCMGILEFSEGDSCMRYNNSIIDNLYSFLKENNVDVVINQIAYTTWLLRDFLDRGGRKWHDEGGKIISCLHFDPCNPSLLYMVKSKGVHNIKDYINLCKTYLFYNYYQAVKKSQEGKVYNYIYDNSDTFVILSDAHRLYLKKVMKRDNYTKLITINNPLTFDSIATKESLDNKKKVVLVCARMSEYHKRISIILKAWKWLQKDGVSNNWVLKLVGDGLDIEKYRNYVKKNKLGNVKFYGQQNPYPFYQEASILLLTSSAEGWGLSITEAMQNGVVPVVMNSSPVYSEIIDDYYNGYLIPNNKLNQYAAHCKMLMTDEHRLHSMQCNALDSAKRFQLINIIEQWTQIL